MRRAVRPDGRGRRSGVRRPQAVGCRSSTARRSVARRPVRWRHDARPAPAADDGHGATRATRQRASGGYGEELAVRYLREQGMEMLDRNWRCELGELDIVARDGDCLVICEVKTRRSSGFGAPVEAVTFARRCGCGGWRRRYLARPPRPAAGRRCASTSSASCAGPGGRRSCGTSSGWGRDDGLGRTRSVALRGVDGDARRRRGAHRAGAAALRDRWAGRRRVRAGARPDPARRGDRGVPVPPHRGHGQPVAGRRSRSAGASFDLAIAVAVLAAAGVIRGDAAGRRRAPRRAGARRPGAGGARRAARGARGGAVRGHGTSWCRSRTSARPSSSTA